MILVLDSISVAIIAYFERSALKRYYGTLSVPPKTGVGKEILWWWGHYEEEDKDDNRDGWGWGQGQSLEEDYVMYRIRSCIYAISLDIQPL